MAVSPGTMADYWIVLYAVFIAAALLFVAIYLYQGQLLFAAGNALVAAILGAGLYARWSTSPERRAP